MMRDDYQYVLYIAETRGYGARLAGIVAKLENHHPEKRIDWKRRATLWLSNFKGPKDQRIAFEILERLLVISQDDTKKACVTLLGRINDDLAKGKSAYHFAHETSGALLLRVLEKDLEIAKDRILRPSDFESPPNLEVGSTIVIWDRFNGTGKQLRTQIDKYRPIFDKPEWKRPTICFAYLAGHPVTDELPPNVCILRAIEQVPSVDDEKYAEQREFCARYAAIANPKANTKYDTGALIAFSDNVTNNVPLILRAAPENSMWRPLFKRKPTKGRSKTPASVVKNSPSTRSHA